MAEVKLANPAVVGLGGFALTTFVLNVHNAAIVPDVGVALPLGLFYGGLAQLVAGFLEFATGNNFGHCAFCGYGAFWIALAALVYVKDNNILPAFKDFHSALVLTLVAWTIFTFILLVASFGHTVAVVVIFITLFVLFLLLDIAIGTHSRGLLTFAGYEGILCALTAWYLMAAIVINDAFGKTVLPIGPLRK